MEPPLQHDSKIIIVGAGVFGLSTTLHLLKRGYTNIHIFDRQPFDQNHYAESSGAHGASCDINKIVRASYGGKQLYQDLAFRAMPEWERWNAELAATPRSELPSSLSPDVKLWHNCGLLRLSADGLDKEELATQQHFPPGIKHTQYRFSDVSRREDAQKDGIPASKIDPFNHLDRKVTTDGILDMTAGFVLASQACTWALYLCMQSGHVTTRFGPNFGLDSLIKNGNRVTGIRTISQEHHLADLILIACGGWTPSLLPQTDRLLETTAGSVLSIQLPANRPDLWEKYFPENFPVWSYNMNSYTPGSNIGGLYGMPRTPTGEIKIAFRGAKWTSYTYTSSSQNEQPLSYPNPDIHCVPEEAMRVLKSFCAINMPDLLSLDLSNIRLCWYTDSVDNSFLVDYVPETEGLVVASGGSGHGFKFLPILGEHIVDVIEKKNTPYTRLFKWRDVPEGKRNGLEEGPEGWRNLSKQKMTGNEHWRNDNDTVSAKL